MITAPVYFFGFLSAFANSLLAQKTLYRAALLIWPQLVDIVGNVLVISSKNMAVRYVGMYLMCAGLYSAFNVLRAWVASTVPRTRTKRAVSYALVNMIGNSSNIYASYFFPSSSGPQFRTGGIILSSFAAGAIFFALIFAFMLRCVNKIAEHEELRTGTLQYKYMW